MSGFEAQHDRECGGDDVAAYALGALTEEEARAFRRHLEECAVCRDELAAFESVIDVLPLSAQAQRAPASLRRRVLRDVANEQRRAAPRRSRFSPVLTGWLRPALVGAAVLAVVVVVALRAGSSTVAPPRVFHAAVAGGGTAELRVSGTANDLVVHHMAPPPRGKIYEVWVKHGDGAPSPTSALFSVTSGGDGRVDVPGNLKGVSLVMVTPEPLGGSQVPTHTPVLTVHL